MSEPLDESYLKWLYSQVSSIRTRNPSRTYWSLLNQLYTKEFIWFVPNDDNRVEDGRELRYEFIRDFDFDDIDPDWMGLGCSVLELIVGLSRRLAFEAEGRPSRWFWHLMDNLDLTEYNDKKYELENPTRKIDNILDTLIWRTYSYEGIGGLFPLRRPDKDQRDVEIWYQLSAYLLEKEY